MKLFSIYDWKEHQIYDLCLKLWNEWTVSHYDRCVQDTDSLSRCLKLYICYSATIESQVNGAYEDDSFCKEITMWHLLHYTFFIFTRNEWGLEIVQVYTAGSFVLINILTFLR